jgi:hypothetical protein
MARFRPPATGYAAGSLGDAQGRLGAVANGSGLDRGGQR